MTRAKAIEGALARYDDAKSGYYADLARLVAIPTESQNPARLTDLARYVETEMRPALERLGYACRIYRNPFERCGPILLATRIEDAKLPTILCYGHGDVVLGMEGKWAKGRDPWVLTFDGDRVYGRGTADNKGQHLAHVTALSAVLAARGRLGFNHKFIVEMGEENGSKGFRELVAANTADFMADAYLASDGPRTEIGKANITLGNRGAMNFDLVCDFRSGGHHSGNWGGLLANPGLVLAHALASIADGRGRILVDGWRPEIPPYVRELLKGIDRDGGPGAPEIDDAWGEPGLTRMEKVSAFNSFEVLAFETGNPAKPVNAVPPKARASCQLRYVVGTAPDEILPALRRHLDAKGFGRVRIDQPADSNRSYHTATRTDPRHPWAQWVKGAVERASGKPCGVLPNSGGSNITHIMQDVLRIPFVWLPLSYAGCQQHDPDEHILKSLTRDGLSIVASVYADLGDQEHRYRT